MEPNNQEEYAEDLSIEFLHKGESFDEPAYLRVTTRILQAQSTYDGSGNDAAHRTAQGAEHNVALIALVALDGVLDMESAPVLRELVWHAIEERTELSAFVFDITQLLSMDSVGLYFFIDLRKRALRTHGITLIVPTDPKKQPLHQPLRLLNVARFGTIFPFFSSRDEAIRAAVNIAREKGQPRTTS